MKNMKNKLLIGFLLSTVFVSPSFGQTQLWPPDIKWRQQTVTPTPTQTVGYDSVTGDPCIVGSSGTCVVSVPGAGTVGAAVPTTAVLEGTNVGGNLVARVGGSCETNARTFTPINIATATTTRIVAPVSAKRTYVCGMFMWAGAANNVAIVEGTGGTCGSGTAGVVGGATAATGLIMGAQNAFVLTSTGYGQFATAGTNVDLCLITSAAVQLSGHVVWVQAP